MVIYDALGVRLRSSSRGLWCGLWRLAHSGLCAEGAEVSHRAQWADVASGPSCREGGGVWWVVGSPCAPSRPCVLQIGRPIP